MSSIIDPQSLSAAPGKGIAQAIKVAAARTGSSFAYLLQTSGIESSFNPNAEAHSSSATGLFQFTGQTWLQMIKAHGAEYGLASYANQIQTGANGALYVSDPASRQAILELRRDPQISAEMTGELGKVNSAILQKNVGGAIGPTELYLAHFLGAGGASSLLKAMRANPNANAAAILPSAAEANPSIFFGAGGQPRSVANIYEHFAQVFDQNSSPIAANPSVPILATAFEHTSPRSSSPVTGETNNLASTLPSAPQSLSSKDAGSFAAIVLGQLNMAELNAALALEDESESAISVIA